MSPSLPPGLQVIERGWLSANLVIASGEHPALVDSGYASHAPQTLQLVQAALPGQSPDLLVNTHLHSDHCGGNALLQATFAAMRTFIPPGQAQVVTDWDEQALSFSATGQHCPRFGFDGLLRPGQDITLGELAWQVHAAPGHDPHSVVLFEADSRTLISADALWENGFGVVFPELEGEQAFDEVSATLDLIETLAPLTVVPGHGPVFSFSKAVMGRARQRLDSFVLDPVRHAQHAGKVLLKFKLLEVQQQQRPDFMAWALSMPYMVKVHQRFFADTDIESWLTRLLADLVKAGAAETSQDWVRNR